MAAKTDIFAELCHTKNKKYLSLGLDFITLMYYNVHESIEQCQYSENQMPAYEHLIFWRMGEDESTGERKRRRAVRRRKDL